MTLGPVTCEGVGKGENEKMSNRGKRWRTLARCFVQSWVWAAAAAWACDPSGRPTCARHHLPLPYRPTFGFHSHCRRWCHGGRPDADVSAARPVAR